MVPGDFNGTKKAIVNDGLETYQKNLAAFVEENGIDGIDYDWEYPQLPHEWNAYSKLLIASKAAIQGRDLSVALWPYGVMLCACIDNVNMMAYDQFDERGDHSPIFEMGADATKHFLRLGFSKEQLCLGIPFYGRMAGGYAIWPSYDEDYGKGPTTGRISLIPTRTARSTPPPYSSTGTPWFGIRRRSPSGMTWVGL